MAATVWMLAGVSSTTRMRSFMGRSLEAVGGGRALEQRLCLAEGVTLDVTFECREFVDSEQRTKLLAVAFENVGRSGIELGELGAHLSHELLERLGIGRRRRRRCAGGRRAFAQRGAQAGHQRSQFAGEALLEGLDD